MRKALILVDYQNDFVTGSLGFEKAAQLEDRIEQKVLHCLKNADDLLVTYDTHDSDYLSTQEGKLLPVPHCIKGSEGWQVYGKLNRYVKDATKVFEKNTFGSLALAQYLQEQGYHCVELVGLVSNICVLSNAILAKAALPDAEIIVYEHCTASADETLHREAMDILRGVQIKVIA